MYAATEGIQNCACQRGVTAAHGEQFTQTQEWALQKARRGDRRAGGLPVDEGEALPCLPPLPMGWNWSPNLARALR
eukprot:2443030-Pyramimonas_sp.AAC.1